MAKLLTVISTRVNITSKVGAVDYWCEKEIEKITVPVGDADIDLQDVVIAASEIPKGQAIALYIMLKYRRIVNLDAGNPNELVAGNASLHVKEDSGAWGVDDLGANIVGGDNWKVAADDESGGDWLIARTNLIAIWQGAATYNLRSRSTFGFKADFASIELHDVQVGLRVVFQ